MSPSILSQCSILVAAREAARGKHKNRDKKALYDACISLLVYSCDKIKRNGKPREVNTGWKENGKTVKE